MSCLMSPPPMSAHGTSGLREAGELPVIHPASKGTQRHQGRNRV